MSWKEVGGWIKENAGAGTALVGSLLTGNVPGAVAAGVALVSSATGTDNPTEALAALQGNPATMIRLKELAIENDKSIRDHIEAMTRLDLEDRQAEHRETQETIRAGDKSENALVWSTRPLQSWLSLLAALYYALFTAAPEEYVLLLLLTLPWSYAGLRQVGKGIDSIGSTIAQKARKVS